MDLDNEEKIIEIIKKYLYEDATYIDKGYEDYEIFKNAIEGLLDLYNTEKRKNEKLKIIVNKLMPLAECYYWDYKNHTCTHTCRGCDLLNPCNTRTESGILIDKDRYCRLYENGHADEDTKFVSVEDLIKRHLEEIKDE